MATGFISDLHANIEGLDSVLDDLRKKGIMELVIIGDVLGYGPNPIEVIDRIIELQNDPKFKVIMMPGNHDDTANAKIEKRLRGLPTHTELLGMGPNANDAVEAQLDMILTKDARAYFAEDYVQRLIAGSSISVPSSLSERVLNTLEEAVSKAKRGFFGKPSMHDIYTSQERALPKLLSVYFQETPKLRNMNKKLFDAVEKREQAKERVDFIRDLSAAAKVITIDGVYCSHASPFNPDDEYAYIYSPSQIAAIKEAGRGEPEAYNTFEDAISAAKRMRQQKFVMAHGHDHIPDIFKTESDGVNLTMVSAGTVGWPRIQQYHNVASYAVKDGNNFEIVLVPYDWEKTYAKLAEAGMPANSRWTAVKGGK